MQKCGESLTGKQDLKSCSAQSAQNAVSMHAAAHACSRFDTTDTNNSSVNDS